MDPDGDARPIGRRLRQIRQARRKSLRVVAGLAGVSSSHLHRIETGARPLDSLMLVLALADALQIAPSELITLPVPAPGNGPTDGAINAVRPALLAVGHNRPGPAGTSTATRCTASSAWLRQSPPPWVIRPSCWVRWATPSSAPPAS
ncbi:MAG: helix-turn-helix domain-containing protein [Pseudonocardiaceae bacterium]